MRGLKIEYLPYQKAGRDGKSGLKKPKQRLNLPTALKPPKIAILMVPPCPLKEFGTTK
jgi:hypothetical protein